MDLSFLKLLVLGVIALIVFGPDQLPKYAAQAGRALRELRRMADGAKMELQDHLGPEFGDFDINDLNPRHFVRKHLMDDLNGDYGSSTADGGQGPGSPGYAGSNGLGRDGIGLQQAELRLAPGESPPYDAEAT
ncbi:MAG: sec-independent translocase [Streptosporangiaceae bacterium]|nr:translocase [Actinomycetota bacterium]